MALLKRFEFARAPLASMTCHEHHPPRQWKQDQKNFHHNPAVGDSYPKLSKNIDDRGCGPNYRPLPEIRYASREESEPKTLATEIQVFKRKNRPRPGSGRGRFRWGAGLQPVLEH